MCPFPKIEFSELLKFYRYHPDPREAESRGFGDTLAEWIDYLGFEEIHMKWFNKIVLPWNWFKPVELVSCGCEFRKWLLNHIFPYFWRG